MASHKHFGIVLTLIVVVALGFLLYTVSDNENVAGQAGNDAGQQACLINVGGIPHSRDGACLEYMRENNIEFYRAQNPFETTCVAIYKGIPVVSRGFEGMKFISVNGRYASMGDGWNQLCPTYIEEMNNDPNHPDRGMDLWDKPHRSFNAKSLQAAMNCIDRIEDTSKVPFYEENCQTQREQCVDAVDFVRLGADPNVCDSRLQQTIPHDPLNPGQYVEYGHDPNEIINNFECVEVYKGFPVVNIRFGGQQNNNPIYGLALMFKSQRSTREFYTNLNEFCPAYHERTFPDQWVDVNDFGAFARNMVGTVPQTLEGIRECLDEYVTTQFGRDHPLFDNECRVEPPREVQVAREVCDNGQDDNFDLAVDCLDPQCQTNQVDRCVISGVNFVETGARTGEFVGEITSCSELSASGVPGRVQQYRLVQDIVSNRPGFNSCLNIGSRVSNVALDCDGHQLSASQRGVGINVQSTNNVQIQNCELSGFAVGIKTFAGQGVIESNIVEDNAQGILLQRGEWQLNENTICGNEINLACDQTQNLQGVANMVDSPAQFCQSFQHFEYNVCVEEGGLAGDDNGDGCLEFAELINLLNAYYGGDTGLEFPELINLLNQYYGDDDSSISC